MTLTEINEILTAVDPQIKHYFSMSKTDAYTYWEETKYLPFINDGRYDEDKPIRFYVHRFTRTEEDPVAEALFSALDQNDRIAVDRTVDYDKESNYIHHIFECEGF